MGKFAILIEIDQKADKELIRIIVEQAVKTNIPQQDIKAVKIITIR